MICLGVDVGSTSIKAGVLDLERNSLSDVIQVPFPAPLNGLPAGFFEVDSREIVQAVQALIQRQLEAEPGIAAVFCCGQMGGTILVHEETGEPLTNYLSWRDQRIVQTRFNDGPRLDELRARMSPAHFAELGSELQAGSTLSLLFWLAKRMPRYAMPACIADFVIARLCRSLPQMHPTHAIGLLDLRSVDWHREAFESLGIGPELVTWPRLASLQEPMGQFDFGGRSIPCYAAVGDQQCALRGIGLKRHELSINISTGSQVSRRTAAFEPGPYQTRCYFGGEFLNTITHLPAGRSLNVLCDLMTEFARAQDVPLGNPWHYIADQVRDIESTSGLAVDLAFFAGPLGDSGSIGGITTENLTVGHLFLAALRNMTQNYFRCFERLGPDRAGLSLALSGGLTRSLPMLVRMIEGRFSMRVRESFAEEETLLGLLDIACEVMKR